MKRIFTTLALAAVIIFAGCTDLDDVYRQLDEQEKELATVRALLNAMTNKVSVVSYKELPDGSGYELTMSDGTKITLKHGAKGNQGERGVKGQQGEDGQDASADLTITETDDTVIIVYKGVTYTISKSVPLPSMTFTTAKAPGGKLRLLIAAAEVDRADVWIDLNNNGNEDEGEKVTRFSQIANYPFTNQTITIYGKVSELVCFGNELTALDVSNNAELVSLLCMKNRLTELNVINNTKLRQLQCYENQISGDKMTELVNSLPDRTGKEKGIFRIINLDTPEEGNSITTSDAAIATGKNWSVEDAYANPYTPPGDTPPGDVLNPLSLVAEYNVNPAGTGFVTSLTACNVSGYFTYGEADTKFTPSITIGGKKYHLPSIGEWHSIVPANSWQVRFKETNSYNDISETVTVQGTSIAMTSDFRTGVGGVSYALRYKGTDLVSAWRYEYIENGDNTHMKITSRSLKGQTGVTVDEIAKQEFWNTNAGNDVTRHFPASGYHRESSLNNVGTRGCFWSSSPGSSGHAFSMYFRSSNADSYSIGNRSSGFSVRLFSSGD